MNDLLLKQILQTTRTIASVGLSSNPEKESYQIVKYLNSQGYRIFPVNPTATEILGETAYADLTAVPEKVDVVSPWTSTMSGRSLRTTGSRPVTARAVSCANDCSGRIRSRS